MRHRRFTHHFRRRSPTTRIVAAAIACGLPRLLQAQSAPTPAQQAVPQLAPYRTPVIALVQPASGGTVPQDKPVVVFRFAQGEPDDAVDAKSFAVSVDGVDVTGGFQVVGGEAWGSLADASPATGASPITPGAHQVIVRICSERGACGSASASVSVISSAQQSAILPSGNTAMSKRTRLLDLVIRATRKLLLP
ncbi:MAG: hypothetical protein HOQ30_17165 [Gemmatimonadaceae bacterium]|nr:hypothetical protein [Gemmatimonadaceae bacterium]